MNNAMYNGAQLNLKIFNTQGAGEVKTINLYWMIK
jgi:hypothetical protein